MLTERQAVIIGFDACIEALGHEFVLSWCDRTGSSFERDGDSVVCFIGADDRPLEQIKSEPIAAENARGFPYYARCTVRLSDGAAHIIECVPPRRNA